MTVQSYKESLENGELMKRLWVEKYENKVGRNSYDYKAIVVLKKKTCMTIESTVRSMHEGRTISCLLSFIMRSMTLLD